MGWGDVGDAGGDDGGVLSPWGEGGWAWSEGGCGGLKALLDRCPPPL